MRGRDALFLKGPGQLRFRGTASWSDTLLINTTTGAASVWIQVLVATEDPFVFTTVAGAVVASVEAPRLYIATLYLEHYHAFANANHTLEFLVDLPLGIGPDDWIVVSHSANILQKRPKFGTEVEPRGVLTRRGSLPEFWEARNAAGIEARRKGYRLHSVAEVMQVAACF